MLDIYSRWFLIASSQYYNDIVANYWLCMHTVDQQVKGLANSLMKLGTPSATCRSPWQTMQFKRTETSKMLAWVLSHGTWKVCAHLCRSKYVAMFNSHVVCWWMHLLWNAAVTGACSYSSQMQLLLLTVVVTAQCWCNLVAAAVRALVVASRDHCCTRKPFELLLLTAPTIVIGIGVVCLHFFNWWLRLLCRHRQATSWRCLPIPRTQP